MIVYGFDVFVNMDECQRKKNEEKLTSSTASKPASFLCGKILTTINSNDYRLSSRLQSMNVVGWICYTPIHSIYSILRSASTDSYTRFSNRMTIKSAIFGCSPFYMKYTFNEAELKRSETTEIGALHIWLLFCFPKLSFVANERGRETDGVWNCGTHAKMQTKQLPDGMTEKGAENFTT